MSVVGIPNNKINNDAVEAAARALLRAQGFDPRDDRPVGGAWLETARLILASAVPYIEAGLREQIAAEIEAVTPNAPQQLRYPDEISLQHARDCFLVAARVARGTREDQK